MVLRLGLLREVLILAALGVATVGVASPASADPMHHEAAAPAATPQSPPPANFSLDEPLTLDELVAGVLTRNQSLVAMAAAVEAARAHAAQAGALDDPMASVMIAPLSLGGGVPFGYEVRGTQRIPYPGKRALREDVARGEAAIAAGNLAAARLELAVRAAELYADYYLNARALEVNTEHIALLGELKDVATARYAAGLAGQQAPIEAEVEAARMLHHEIELRAAKREIVAQLDALLHRPTDAELPAPPAELAIDLSAAMEHAARADTAVVNRPELAAAAAAVAAREGELALARRARQPDFDLMAGYSSMWDTREHRFTVGVGLNLPIRRSRLRAQVAEALSRRDEAQAELERTNDTVRSEAVAAAAHREEMAHLVVLYRERVLPAASDQVAAARASFESGEEPMLGVIEAERSLRDAQLQYHEAVAGLLRTSAALARSKGEIPSLTTPAAPPAER